MLNYILHNVNECCYNTSTVTGGTSVCFCIALNVKEKKLVVLFVKAKFFLVYHRGVCTRDLFPM